MTENINILSHTTPDTYLHLSSHAYHQRTSWPQHIMAQSADPNPTHHQRATPARTATPPDNMTRKLPQTNPAGLAEDATIYWASRLEVSPIADPHLTPSHSHRSSEEPPPALPQKTRRTCGWWWRWRLTNFTRAFQRMTNHQHPRIPKRTMRNPNRSPANLTRTPMSESTKIGDCS